MHKEGMSGNNQGDFFIFYVLEEGNQFFLM